MMGEGKGRGSVSLCSSLFSLSTLLLPPDPIFIIIRGICRRKKRERKKRKREGGGMGHMDRKFQNLMINMKSLVFFPDWFLYTDVPMML